MNPSGLPAEMFQQYWHTWLPYAVAVVVLAALAAIAGVNAGVRSIAPAGMFAVAAVALAILGAAAGLLADAASEGDGLTVFDRPTWRWFINHRSSGGTVIAKIVTTIGSTLVMGILAGAVTVLLVVRRRRGDAAMVAVVGAGAGLLVIIGKGVVGRIRPPARYRLVAETNASFPSGHALASMAIVGVFTVLLAAGTQSVGRRVGTILTAVVVVLLIGASRLYLGVHWATDVLGGWVTGAAWLLLCVLIRRLWRSYRDNQARGRPTGTDPGTIDDANDAMV